MCIRDSNPSDRSGVTGDPSHPVSPFAAGRGGYLCKKLQNLPLKRRWDVDQTIPKPHLDRFLVLFTDLCAAGGLSLIHI